MKKIVILSILFVPLIGCELVDKASETIIEHEPKLIAAQEVTPMLGSYGWIISGVLGITLAAAKTYDELRKRSLSKVISAVKNERDLSVDEQELLESVLQSIVSGVESIAETKYSESSTIGDLIKTQVRKELEKHGIYAIGKELISRAKEGA